MGGAGLGAVMCPPLCAVLWPLARMTSADGRVRLRRPEDSAAKQSRMGDRSAARDRFARDDDRGGSIRSGTTLVVLT
jgi:hypothetical protein